jgi:hypothetical protein
MAEVELRYAMFRGRNLGLKMTVIQLLQRKRVAV